MEKSICIRDRTHTHECKSAGSCLYMHESPGRYAHHMHMYVQDRCPILPVWASVPWARPIWLQASVGLILHTGENRQRLADVKIQQASDESPDVSFVKAAAEDACSEPSFLKVAPVGCNRAQRPTCHGSKTLAPTPSNEPEAVDAVDPRREDRCDGSGDSFVVRPGSGVFEPGSSTPASADADFDVIVRRRWDEHIASLPPLVAGTKRWKSGY